MESAEQEGESSAKRRERLLALRSAAASSSPSAEPPPRPPASAAWDLPGPDLMDPATPRPPPPPRFDYYTNPAAAFSSSAAASHKRKSAYSSSTPSPAPAPPYAGSGNYGSNYPPPHQHHVVPSPIHSPSPMAPDAPGSSPWRSPMQFQTPMSGYRGTPGAPPPWNPHSASPAQGSYPHSPGFGFGPRGSNLVRGGSPMNYGPRGSPMSYGPRGSPMNYGPRGSPYSSSGRGRGENYYSSPGSRGRGGRGDFGFQNRSGWQDRRSYHGKCMVDDPWRDLQPIVGNILIPRDGFKSWLPESLRAKKDTSGQGQIKPTSGLSLAEYLDLSFNEASNKA